MRGDGSREGEGPQESSARVFAIGRVVRAVAVGMVVSLASARWPCQAGDQHRPAIAPRGADPLPSMQLPAAWRVKYWQCPEGKALLRLGPKAVAGLVPVQSGVRFCRCPVCGAEESDDPLTWSIEHPTVVTCRRCGATVPNDRFPAKVNKEVPEEKVEVIPGVVHVYPYHTVEEGKARYPDERLYLRAKVDYEARKSLAKAALYCASEYRAQIPAARDPRMAVLACAIMLRFAQVYPAYATHCDQPGRPKVFQPARLNPPFRRGYRTGKWEWSGCLEVPMNLTIAYALLRGDPSWDEAGKVLGDHHPERTVETDLFRASAELARAQTEEYSEDSLHIYRGLWAVGRILGDAGLENEALSRLAGFTRRGFYHDGFWRGAEVESHRRVLGQIEGWLGAPVTPDSAVNAASVPGGKEGRDPWRDSEEFSILELARRAGAAIGPRNIGSEVRLASWPLATPLETHRRPILLGGAGLARLAIGDGEDALDLEIRGLDSFSGPHFSRLALRVSIGGKPILDDLDERAPTSSGWEMATPSHNVVIVDGLNQRETPTEAARPVAGSDFVFFAADPDFQVASVEDPRAYPQSTTRYRQTLIATASRRCRYALSVFEVHGGLQHDQVFHAAPGVGREWLLSIPTRRPQASLLPSSIPFLASARPEQGRWFVQSYGEFRIDAQGDLTGPALAGLVSPGTEGAGNSRRPQAPIPPAIRLHLLNDDAMTAFTATTPVATFSERAHPPGDPDCRRGALILRRKSPQGSTLKTTFVTLFEPSGQGMPALRRVGRVASNPDVVVVLVESIDGQEYLVVNLAPGKNQRVQLPSGRFVSFDGVALRIREGGLVMAGGRVAEGSGKLLTQAAIVGTLRDSVRKRTERGRGWFVTADTIPADPGTAGRTLVVRHGDGTCRSWTLDSIESSPEGTRLHVREEPGFAIDPRSSAANYYQFPHVTAPGPHRFSLSQITR